MKCFVQSFADIYGKEYVSYNVHCLIHLSSDVLLFGNVDNFSAFSFKNYQKNIKEKVRKSEKLLQQLNNRFKQMMVVNFEEHRIDTEIKLSGEHFNSILSSDCCGPQYSEIHIKGLKLSIEKPDNCCVLNDGTIILIKNICFSKCSSKPVIVGHQFTQKVPYYDVPCSSVLTGIFKAKSLSTELKYWKVDKIQNKCCCFYNFETNPVIIPLLHSN